MSEAGESTKQLRVGVLGLGPRWRRRYKQALQALRQRFQVTAVCDQMAELARLEAGRLGCAALAGPTELFESPDVDAVLLLDRQWYRLWPLEAACRTGKPVFCCDGPERDEPHADRLHQAVSDSQVPVMVGLVPRWAPATARLRELCAGELGPPRTLLAVVTGRVARRKDPKPCGPDLFACPPALLDWCGSLLEGDPARVLATGLPGGQLANLLLDYGDGRAVQVSQVRARKSRPGWRLQVIAEHGTAAVDALDRVCWSSAAGRFRQDLPRRRPLSQLLLEQFHDAVVQRRRPRPDLADAYRALQWLRLAGRSLSSGQWLGASG